MDHSRNRPRDYTLEDVLAVAPGYATLKDLAEGLNLANSSAHHYWNFQGWLEKIKGALAGAYADAPAKSESRSPSVLAQAEDAAGAPQWVIDATEEEYGLSAPQTLASDEIDYYEDLVKYKNSEVSRLQGQVRKLRGQLYDRDESIQMVGEVIEGAVERHRAKNPECIKYVARSKTREDWVCIAPIADLHAGKYVWGQEGWGRDYDTSESSARLEEHGRQVAAWIRGQGGTCVRAYLPDIGDTFHALNNATEHGTILHQDTRAKKVYEMTFEARLADIEEVRKACDTVYVYEAEGNHDHQFHWGLYHAIDQYYRDCDDVVVKRSPSKKVYFVEGDCLFFFDHGYGISRLSTPSAMAKMRLTVEQRVPNQVLSSAKRVHVMVGHLHHEERKEDGKYDYRRLPAMCEPDDYEEMLRVASRPGAVAFRLRSDGFIGETVNLYF